MWVSKHHSFAFALFFSVKEKICYKTYLTSCDCKYRWQRTRMLRKKSTVDSVEGRVLFTSTNMKVWFIHSRVFVQILRTISEMYPLNSVRGHLRATNFKKRRRCGTVGCIRQFRTKPLVTRLHVHMLALV